jgi:DHA1 family inner membrane transport protein
MEASRSAFRDVLFMPSTDSAASGIRAIAPHGVGIAEIALAIGGLAIGTAEFAAMGVLPEIARDLGVSVPQAGHLISAYALGVVVGAPAITILMAKMPRKGLLVGLMLLYALGNFATTVFHSYAAVFVSRFVAGLPHGAYFGVASLVAASMVPPSRRGEAIGKVIMGLSVANVLGVPAATWLGETFGWRSTFMAVAVIALLCAAMIFIFVPSIKAEKGASALTEMGALKRTQVWLTLLAAAIGFGGIFAVYSYITPLLTEVTHLPLARVPLMLSLIGIGMVVGSVVCGKLADRWLKGTMLGMYAFTAVILTILVFVAHSAPAMIVVLFLIGVCTMVTVSFQARLMDVAGDAQSLAAALNHSAFNIANALGAWLGGMAIAAGFGWTSTGWVGLGLSLAGILVLVGSFALDRKQAARRVR